MVKLKDRKSHKLLWTISLYIIIAIFGFATHGVYDEFKDKRILNGLYVYNSDNISEAKEYAYSKENKGDWVCINVAYKMTPKEAYSTCVHECSHKAFSEIYAEECEENPLICLEGLYEK